MPTQSLSVACPVSYRKTPWTTVLPYRASVWLFAVLMVAPLATAVLGSFEGPVAGYTLAGWRELWHEPRLAHALLDTAGLTAVTQAVAMLVGILVSWLLGRTDLPGRRWLELAFWISFFLPSLAIVQGWTLMLDPHYGLVNKWLMAWFDLPQAPLDVYSLPGIVFAHLATTTLSAKVMMLTPAFQSVDARLEEAAVMAGDGRLRALRRISLPLVMPAVMVALLLGVVYQLQSFEIELVLGAPRNLDVYSTVIYDMTRADPIDFAGAFALGNVIVAVTVSLAWLARGERAAGRHVTVSGQAQVARVTLGRWRWPASVAVSALALLLTAIPLAFLVASSLMVRFGFFNLPAVWTGRHWLGVLDDPGFLGALRNTFVLAGGSSLCAVVVSTLVAYAIVRGRGWTGTVLELSAWIPSSIPGVLFSVAWLWLILRSGVDGLYGSAISLIVVVALAWITLAVQLIRSQLMQISPQLEEAALLAGASPVRMMSTIVVPLCSRTLVVVALMVFVSAVRDVGHIALLTTGDNQPLSILQLGLLTEGRSEAASVIGVMLAAAATAAALAARRLSPVAASH